MSPQSQMVYLEHCPKKTHWQLEVKALASDKLYDLVLTSFIKTKKCS